MRLTACLLLLALASACDAPSGAVPAGSAARVSLSSSVSPEDVVARVGPLGISGELVRQVASTQGVDFHTATERVASDALFALESRSRGLDDGLGRIDSAVLARSLNRMLVEEARAKGPMTEQELADLSERHSYDLARPESWTTVHSLVKLAKDASDGDVSRAKEVAQTIESAIRPIARETVDSAAPAGDPGEDPQAKRFLEAANAVDKKGFALSNQVLPGIAADGKSVTPGERKPFDPEFVRAAMTLQKRGDMVGSVRSSFGVHVIMLVDRQPARILDADKRRDILHDEAIANRQRVLEEALLAEVSRSTPVIVERNVDAVLELLQVSP